MLGSILASLLKQDAQKTCATKQAYSRLINTLYITPFKWHTHYTSGNIKALFLIHRVDLLYCFNWEQKNSYPAYLIPFWSCSRLWIFEKHISRYLWSLRVWHTTDFPANMSMWAQYRNCENDMKRTWVKYHQCYEPYMTLWAFRNCEK